MTAAGNSHNAKEKLGWVARYTMKDVVRMMVEDRINQQSRSCEIPLVCEDINIPASPTSAEGTAALRERKGP
jgi:hypothetical protein